MRTGANHGWGLRIQAPVNKVLKCSVWKVQSNLKDHRGSAEDSSPCDIEINISPNKALQTGDPQLRESGGLSCNQTRPVLYPRAHLYLLSLSLSSLPCELMVKCNEVFGTGLFLFPSPEIHYNRVNILRIVKASQLLQKGDCGVCQDSEEQASQARSNIDQ